MNSGRLTRQIALLAGGAALIGMGTLTACSTKEKEAPAPTSTPSTSQAPSTSEAPAMSTPTEKAVGPAGPSFSPTVNPVPPGAVCNKIVNGVCSR
jgi:multidrug efflux pump subunit AcrA (membrane-fusion protein)